MKKVAFTLTHMQGPEVAEWVKDMGTMLNRLNPITNNIPDLWNQFLEEFEAQYQDSQWMEKAKDQIEKLKMRPNIGQYISEFKELCRKAQFTLGNPETQRMFLKGLPEDILWEVYHGGLPDNYVSIKTKAIRSTTAQQELQNLLSSKPSTGPGRQTQGPHRPFYGGNRGSTSEQWRQNNYNSSNALRSFNNMPVPMDLSQTKAPPRQRGQNYQNVRGLYWGRYGGNRANYQGFSRANVAQTNN